MSLPKRLLSIDVFRAITMLLMIFVNEAAGVRGIPEWLGHVPAEADGLGFSDTIFPAFLFIVGLSLPFAIKGRINRGDSTGSIAAYILIRAAALIIMGFFHVNMEGYNSETALIPRAVWTMGITISFFLIWLDYSPQLSKPWKNTLIGLGVLLLACMAYIYQTGHPQGMQPSWWGILGIIGWAYLICALYFLLVQAKFPALLAGLAALLAVNILDHTIGMPFNIPILGDASSAALIMAGVVLSETYALLAKSGRKQNLWTILLVAGILAIIAGILIRPYAEGISKIRSTPAWVLLMTGMSILVFQLLIYLVDVRKKENWFKLIRPAGTSTLTCYLIPYLLYSLMRISGLHYPAFLSIGYPGLLRCFLVSFLIILFVGYLEKWRLRLKV